MTIFTLLRPEIVFAVIASTGAVAAIAIPVSLASGGDLTQVTASDFAALDRDKDGTVSLAEWLFGVSEPDESARRLTFYERDLDADGRLSADEAPNDDPAKICPHFKTFRNLDVDRDGTLSREEYVGPARPKFEAAAEQEFVTYDHDEDGQLTYDEFCQTPRIALERGIRFRRLDVDGNQSLTCGEFLRPICPPQRPLHRQIFYSFDADNNQELSLDEYLKQGAGVVRSLRNKYLARDANDDGRLSREEYWRPFVGTQWEQGAKTESVQYDVDKDGFLTLLEFAMTPQDQPHTEEVFPLLDTDGDRFLTRAEFLQARPREQWPFVGAMFYRIDADADGRVSVEEYRQQGSAGRIRPDVLVKLAEDLFADVESACASADRDGDGRLTSSEWPRQRLQTAAADLVELPFSAWDQNGDGAVTPEEQRLLVEVAYGIRRSNGQLLRQPGGYVFIWAYVRALDKNNDDVLSRKEFVGGHYEGGKNADRFREADKNADGQLTIDELLALPWMFADVFWEFCNFDADNDGRLTTSELIERAAPWQKAMAPRLIAAFDRNRDGALDVDEYVLSPFAHKAFDWYIPRTDADHDGRLSWEEYYGERPPLLCGIFRRFFRSFDRDGDGYLSRRELDFSVDIERAPAEAALLTLDKNGDGVLQLADLFDEPRPPASDPGAVLRWEERTMRLEEAIRDADRDQNGVLSLEEFEKQQVLLTAVILGKPRRAAAIATKPPASLHAPDGKAQSWDWRFIGLVACNAVLLVGVAWMALKPGTTSK